MCDILEDRVDDGRPCPCGSGLPFERLFDARGIYVGRVCRACRKKVMARYRPEIFTDPNYEVDEDVEPEE